MADDAKFRRYLEKVTVDLRKAHQQVRDLENSAHQPIAIVGMACRYPGGIACPGALWSFVAGEGDAISEFPADRGWDLERLYDPDPDNPGTTYTKWGGFLTEATEFDAGFFGISAGEAEAMDPQERLVLEVSWEALEDAGIDPASLYGTASGVFAGVGDRNYGPAAGLTSSIVSGRVAYALGLEGPAISVDTACSSSLVATHLASQALRQGECTLALAGGVTVLSSPSSFVAFSAQRGLAPDGRSKSFAEAADGVAWAEGVGMLLLERLSDAKRAGHEVLALIKGSAVNQDGASNGLTAPNGPSQERVIRQALANARLEPKDVDAVEAHGTGTTLGDPIEAGALLATYGQDREAPLRLGSLKSNIGHTQAAAGVAGTIKMVEAMRRGVLPKTLHVDAPSSKVEWETGRIELLTEAVQWEPNGKPRRAGVSSFGISGTNAHVILEEAPGQVPVGNRETGDRPGASSEQPLTGPIPLALSAKTEPALLEAAERLASHLEANPDLDPEDVAFSLLTSRSAFEHRAVALGESREELLASLGDLAEGKPSPNLITAKARQGRLAYLLTGQGSQRLAMGKELYAADPLFEAALDSVCKELDRHLDTPLKEILFAKGKRAKARLEDTANAQPALFAIEVALAGALAKRGLRPELLAGHSVGEIAAAHLAGVLELPDAARLITARGALMGALPKGGAMAAIEATEQEVAESIAGKEQELSIAAINTPASTVISGTEEAVEEVRSRWQDKGKKTKRLAVSHAFHSPLMEPMLAELAELCSSLSFKAPRIPIVSNLSGQTLTEEQATDPAYWVRQAREPVRFKDSVEALDARGATTYLELGPDPVLCAAARETLGEQAGAGFIPTLREGRKEQGTITTAIAHAHAAGARVDREAFFKGTNAKRVPLPTYPFQRKRYWPASASSGSGDLGDTEHPLLGSSVEVADARGDGFLLTGRISLATHSWLEDHAVDGVALLPGTALLELAFRAAERVGARFLDELALESPLVIPDSGAVAIQVSVSGPDEEGRHSLSIHSRPEGDEGGWAQNASGSFLAGSPVSQPSLSAWPPPEAEPFAIDDLEQPLAARGLQLGAAFQGVAAAWEQAERLYAEVSLYGVEAPALRLSIAPEGREPAILAYDRAGSPLFALASLAVAPIDLEVLRAASPRRFLHRVAWQPVSAIVSRRSSSKAAEPEVVEILPAEGEVPEAAQATAEAALARLQEWIDDERPESERLIVLTHQAIAAGNDDVPEMRAAPVWGLVRSAISEHPGRIALVDIDGTEASKEALAGAIDLTAEEPQLALRGGEILVPRLARVGAWETTRPERFDPERTVLVTGGLSGLGALLARHLAATGQARHLLLVSRRGEEAPAAPQLRAELEELGAEVMIAACDVTERGSLDELFASIPEDRPLGAIVHSAGALDDGVLDSMTPERLARTMEPKATAAWHLHELSRELELSRFVLFSSAAGLLGGAAQANYAAANNFLDALAHRRRAEGLPATALAWGMWESASSLAGEEVGELLEQEEVMARVQEQVRQRLGFDRMSPEQGLELFDAAQATDDPLLAPVRFDTAVLRSRARAGALAPIMSALVKVRVRPGAASGAFAAKLAAIPEAERHELVLELVRAQAAAVLGHSSPTEVEPVRAFGEMGLDSLGAVELRNRLSAATGLRVGATVVFDYPNAVALAEHLLAEASASGAAKSLAVRATASEEPIAIVGMACRYPGAVASPEGLWRLLAAERDGIGEFPADRGWDLERLYDPDPEHPGTTYTKQGGFLDEATEFDAGFFSISPREAEAMDPQERLVLEVSWEALEDAGIDPASLHQTATGVFAGVGSRDYGPLPGVTSSIVSGRVSYALGLEGPAISVDTACSSSLVALHLASQALRGGECSLALAGGITVLSTPTVFTEFSRQRNLAPDGRSKSFAEAADGTGFSEGVGMLLLERLSEAERNGHEVLALLKGSAVNQDGASNGLTAPNGPSQERVIRQALANARLEPKDVDAVEAHGTGTTLGDPIEAGALLATYGQDREAPLRLGSLKSNIGHTQAAAGVAGTIKMVEAMRRGVLPKTLHVDAPSSKVEWETGRIELLTEAVQWEPNGKPRRAGVSSFGISGTNAHVILEEAPGQVPVGNRETGDRPGASSEQPLTGPIPLALSAKSEPALAEAAERLASHLEDNPDLDPEDVAFSLLTSRSAFEHRAVALGGSREELLASLGDLAEGKENQSLARGRARTKQRPIFLFPGQGSQWEGMALDLIDASPVFAAKLAECEQALAPHVDWSVTEVLRQSEGAPSIERIEVVQPTLFAVMASLAALWRACGVHPAAVAGHSQGEIVAAHVAGGLSLEDAAMLAALRSRIISKLAGKGGMVSIALAPAALGPLLEPFGQRIALAAHNGPSSTILSGDREALDALLERCEEEQIRAREIPAAIASHSAYVEEVREEVLDTLAPLSPRSGEIPFHSTVTGGLLDTAELGASYWYRNLRETVRFEEVTRELIERGARSFIEVSPHPVFALAVGETIEAVLGESAEASAIGTLRREEDGPRRFALSLAEAHVNGVELDGDALFAGSGAKAVKLPTYPFQRKRYWLASGQAGADAAAIGLTNADHPLLGAAIEDPAGQGLTLSGRISLSTHPWLADHAVAGTVLLPGTAFLELALQAAELLGAEGVEELVLQAPLLLEEEEAVAVRVTVSAAAADGRREISIHSRPEAQGGEWAQNAGGSLGGEIEAPAEPLKVWPPPGAEPLEIDYLYDLLAEAGVEYGPAFQGLTAAWREGGRIYAEASLPGEQAAQAQSFAVHPALLDSALHGIALAKAEGGAGIELPFSWSGVALHAEGPTELRVQIDTAGDAVSLRIADGAGAPVASVDSLALRTLNPGVGLGREGLLALDWAAVSLPKREGTPVAKLLRIEIEGEGAKAGRRASERALTEIQSWLGEEPETGSRLVFLTEGAMVIGGDESPNPAAAALWGLVRSAQSEHPGRFALIDSDGSEESETALPRALELGEEEPQLALRRGGAFAPRLGRTRKGDPGEEMSSPIDPENTILITGATGALGSLVARHVVERHGARHLLLASRSGPEAEGAGELTEDLRALGAQVEIVACDVSERDALETLLASIPAEHPLGSVVHAAGALVDGTVAAMRPKQLAQVFAPKADAAWHLHELTAGLDLDAFVLFSALGGTLGAPGQANYAAANVFLDALAQRRRAEGLPATSIAWGLWDRRSAMTSGVGEVEVTRMQRVGLESLSDEHGLALLDAALDCDRATVAAAPLNSTHLRALAAGGSLPPILRGLVSLSRRRLADPDLFAARLTGLPKAEARSLVADLVRGEAAAVLGYASAQEVEPDMAFQELGFDSLGAVELRNRLSMATGLRLPATVVFDYPSSAALAEHVFAAIAGTGENGVSSESREVEIQEALATIPLSRLRRAGLLDPLMRLADSGDAVQTEVEPDDTDLIDSAAVDDLIRMSAERLPAAPDKEALS